LVETRALRSQSAGTLARTHSTVSVASRRGEHLGVTLLEQRRDLGERHVGAGQDRETNGVLAPVSPVKSGLGTTMRNGDSLMNSRPADDGRRLYFSFRSRNAFSPPCITVVISVRTSSTSIAPSTLIRRAD
jgi:hypothetical protein